jgi:PIN domain nuclease of toxin-antitoxin system
MRLLLDTHTFLWFVAGASTLSRTALRRIQDARHDKFLSVASIWEMAIKLRLGKLSLDVSLERLVEEGAIDNGISVVDVLRSHAEGVAHLASHHADPFDRLLVSQALCEDMAIVSADTAFDDYSVKRIW